MVPSDYHTGADYDAKSNGFEADFNDAWDKIAPGPDWTINYSTGSMSGTDTYPPPNSNDVTISGGIGGIGGIGVGSGVESAPHIVTTLSGTGYIKPIPLVLSDQTNWFPYSQQELIEQLRQERTSVELQRERIDYLEKRLKEVEDDNNQYRKNLANANDRLRFVEGQYKATLAYASGKETDCRYKDATIERLSEELTKRIKEDNQVSDESDQTAIVGKDPNEEIMVSPGSIVYDKLNNKGPFLVIGESTNVVDYSSEIASKSERVRKIEVDSWVIRDGESYRAIPKASLTTAKPTKTQTRSILTTLVATAAAVSAVPILAGILQLVG